MTFPKNLIHSPTAGEKLQGFFFNALFTMAGFALGGAGVVVFPPPPCNDMVITMIYTDYTETIELDVLPEGLRLHATTLTLEVEFSFNPGQPASLDIWPPEPAEPATVEIIAMRVKKPAPKFSKSDFAAEWERAPSCFDEMVEEILLDRMGAGG